MVTTGWMAEEMWSCSWQGQEIFLFTKASRPSLVPIWPPIKWVLRALSPEVMLLRCEADHFSIVLRLRMSEVVPLLSQMPSYHVQGQPCFTEVQLILRVTLICLAEVT